MTATPDPTDAKADGQFAGADNPKLERALEWARKGFTLKADEARLLAAEVVNLRALAADAARYRYFRELAATTARYDKQWKATLASVAVTLTIDDAELAAAGHGVTGQDLIRLRLDSVVDGRLRQQGT